MRRERPVEPVPMRAAGESEPFSQEFPALSPPGVETVSLSVGGGRGCEGGGWRGSVECDVEAADVFALSSGLDDDHVLTV